MKITVKNLIGTKFQIEVNPQDTVADVKQNIETVKGPEVYPVSEQKLIYKGKFLKDATTLEENKVAERSTILILLSKSQSSTSGSSTTSAAPTTAEIPEQTEVPTVAQSPIDGPSRNPPPPRDPNANPQSRSSTTRSSTTVAPRTVMDILEQAVFSRVAQAPINPPPPPSPGPNTRPLDLFPQDRRYANPGGVIIDFLRNNRGFTHFRALAQVSPQVLPYVVAVTLVQRPHVIRELAQLHDDFFNLMREPIEDHRNILRLVTGLELESPFFRFSVPGMYAVFRLERRGYDRARVVDALLLCNMNEAEALRYLSGRWDNSWSESKSKEEGNQ